MPATGPCRPARWCAFPLGNREVLGVVWRQRCRHRRAARRRHPARHRRRAGRRGAAGFALAPPGGLHGALLPAGLGEVALAALPPQLRDLKPEQLARRLRRPALTADDSGNAIENIALTAERKAPEPKLPQTLAPFCCLAAPAVAKPRCTCAACKKCWKPTPPPGVGDGA